MLSESAVKMLGRLRNPSSYQKYESGHVASKLDKRYVCLELPEKLQRVFICAMLSDTWHDAFEAVAEALMDKMGDQHLVRLAMAHVFYAELKPNGFLEKVLDILDIFYSLVYIS
jgi:hypothetical protein